MPLCLFVLDVLCLVMFNGFNDDVSLVLFE